MPRRRSTRGLGEASRRAQREHLRDSQSPQHEIHVYQEELRAQNEELIRARRALEDTRDRFIELYDFAPNGYLTLDANGVMLQVNLTAASLLGRQRHTLEGMPLLTFVSNDDHGRLLEFLRRCRSGVEGGSPHLEVRVETANGPRDVELISKVRLTTDGRKMDELLTAIIDVTWRKQLETERLRAMRDHAMLASRLLSAQDEERQRIARDLHDNVGQQVTALRLLLKVAQMDPRKDGTLRRLAKAESIIDQLDRELDFMSSQLRPASLDLGIIAAVEQFVREWSATFGVPVECRCDLGEDVRLGRDVETHIYRVTQEALNNVYKHARAARVSVTLQRQSNDIVLTVADDGRGFEPDAESRQQERGLGLMGMRERAQLIGGRIDVKSSPSTGTTVVLRVPIAGRTESR